MQLTATAGRQLVVHDVAEEHVVEAQEHARARNLGEEPLLQRFVEQLEQRVAVQSARPREQVDVELTAEDRSDR